MSYVLLTLRMTLKSPGYVVHLDAVAEIVQQYGEPAVVIAYLHDVVEDTSVSLLDIEKEFGRFDRRLCCG